MMPFSTMSTYSFVLRVGSRTSSDLFSTILPTTIEPFDARILGDLPIGASSAFSTMLMPGWTVVVVVDDPADPPSLARKQRDAAARHDAFLDRSRGGG